MPKTFTDLVRHTLSGPTMGTRWSALFHAPPAFDPEPARAAMAAAVAEVDAQMSTWKPDSDLNRLSAAGPGDWVLLPAPLMEVLSAGLDVGRATGGAFDIGMGDAVTAWGFGAEAADADRISAARAKPRRPAHECLELDHAGARARKSEPMVFDLSGIAKGYGVDRLARVARSFGINDALLAIDGELRALGSQPDGSAWTVAVEAPDPDRRAPHSILELSDTAVATSGDYRHWVQVGTRRLGHTMDPRRGMPLAASPASVTVLAGNCMTADAWATAMLVLGQERGLTFARTIGLSVLFISGNGTESVGTGSFAPVTPLPMTGAGPLSG